MITIWDAAHLHDYTAHDCLAITNHHQSRYEPHWLRIKPHCNGWTSKTVVPKTVVHTQTCITSPYGAPYIKALRLPARTIKSFPIAAAKQTKIQEQWRRHDPTCELQTQRLQSTQAVDAESPERLEWQWQHRLAITWKFGHLRSFRSKTNSQHCIHTAYVYSCHLLNIFGSFPRWN